MLAEPITFQWEPWTEEELEAYFNKYSQEQEEKKKEINYELN